MLIFYAILFGIVQGLTEFLPVSSSGHLVILHQWFDLGLVDSLGFDVALHLGTLLALLAFFWREVLALLRGWFQSFIHWDLANNANQRLAWMILIASLPVVAAGYFFEDGINELFRAVPSVAILLIVFGLLFFFYEKLGLQSLGISTSVPLIFNVVSNLS
ncbi:undecaprenyl-diphosphate phosphatase [Candidatus Falkowbacteria bacterium]|nr:undecaprenyl-diphosphate phosphatase [Candidatus Falkowbacteria bacterium]